MKKRIRSLIKVTSVLAAIALFICYIVPSVRPGSVPYLPLTGLLYPLLLLVNIAFLILWIVRKSPWLLMQGAVILVGLGFMTDTFTLSMGEERTDRSLRVMTYNVRLFGYYQWKENRQIRDRIFDRLRKENADVMCFQEFYHTDSGKFQTKNLLLEFSDTPYIHEKYTHEMIHDQHFGVVTVSRYPIIHRGFIPFKGAYQNFCIYSDIQLPEGDTLRVFNGHLASIHFRKEEYALMEGKEDKSLGYVGGAEQMLDKLDHAYRLRADQIDLVMEEVERSPYPVLLCGDFNDVPISYCYNRVGRSLSDAFKDEGNGLGVTYNGKLPGLRIDYIFNSEDIDVLNYRTPRDDNSDHFPIVVDIELAEEKD